MLIHVDHSRDRRDGVGISRSHRRGHLLLGWTSLRRRTDRGVQRFDEEAYGRRGVPGGTEQKLERVAFRIDGPGDIHPGFLYFDVGLIHSPGIVASFEVRPTAFFGLWGVSLRKAVSGKHRGLTWPCNTLPQAPSTVAQAGKGRFRACAAGDRRRRAGIRIRCDILSPTRA